MMEAWEWRRVFDSLPDATEEQMAEVRARRLREWEAEMEEFERKWGRKGMEARKEA